MRTSTVTEGMVLDNKYKIIRIIGFGSMAHVFLASNLFTDTCVAIKILKPELANHIEYSMRFDTEYQIASALCHPNIVSTLDFGLEDNLHYMVQEYIDGVTVNDLIRKTGPLNWRFAVQIAIQVSQALDLIHKNGFIHCDINPKNVMITKDQVVKLIDFGIAFPSDQNNMPSIGCAHGSIYYSSPEQIQNSVVNPSSDIYSLGVTLFEMITGRVPFKGDNAIAIARKHLNEPIPSASSLISGIPHEIDDIIQKALQKEPQLRYKSTLEMVNDLMSTLGANDFPIISNFPL